MLKHQNIVDTTDTFLGTRLYGTTTLALPILLLVHIGADLC